MDESSPLPRELPVPRPDDRTLSASPLAGTGEAAPVLQPGQVFGPYRVVRSIGSGGMGVVYEAEELASHRRVALKVLAQRLASAEHRERFLREGRLMAAVNHPNTVYIFGTGETAGIPWIAMELVRGGTLRHNGDNTTPLDVPRAVDAILQVIAGLEASTRAGILHRDIKPSNCFVDADGAVKIGDFGLSVSTAGSDDATRTAAGTILGTPAFASPEQLRGESVDARSDQYSVGATLYWTLCGRAPFAEQGVQLIGAILGRPPEFPPAAVTRLPPGLIRAVLRCLAKKPSERYADYAALAAALRPYGSARLAKAPMRIRAVAGVLDVVVATLGQMIVGFVVVAVRPQTNIDTPAISGAMAVGVLLVFAWMEGRWGRTPGRIACGLTVIGPQDGLPGLPRALIRGAVFNAFNLVYLFEPKTTATWELLGILWVVVLFAPRAWGRVPLHDRATGTGVAVRRDTTQRFVLGTATTPPVTEIGRQFGPYDVIRRVFESSTDSVDEAVDARLERPVWIHSRQGGAGPDEARQMLTRVTRPRWLQSAATWDAYGMPGGAAFLAVATQSRDWSVVGEWLRDAVHEMAAAQSEPLPLMVDETRLWITGEGRLVLTDFPVSPSAPAEGFAAGDLARAQPFLHRIAAVALRGCSWTDRPTITEAALPMRVRAFLAELDGAKFETWAALTAATADAAAVDAGVTRSRRALQILTYLIFPLMAASIGLGQERITVLSRMELLWGGLLGFCLQGFLVGVVGVAAAFFTREGLLLRLFGMGLTDSEGALPSRLQLALRSILAALLCLPLLLAQAGRTPQPEPTRLVCEVIALLAFALLLLCTALAIRNPKRGPLETLTATRIVRR